MYDMVIRCLLTAFMSLCINAAPNTLYRGTEAITEFFETDKVNFGFLIFVLMTPILAFVFIIK
jgi:hypothetical protein